MVLSGNNTLWVPLPSGKGSASTCAQPPQFPVQSYGGVAVVAGGRAGFCAGSLQASCFTLDPTNNTWEEIPALPYPNLQNAACVQALRGWWVVGECIWNSSNVARWSRSNLF